MNENEKPIQPEKSGLDEKKKSALLRYVAIMFAVAFVLVLFSLLGQMRNSMSTISELNQSSSSALQKAEQLQKDNLELELQNQQLTLEMEALQKKYTEMETQLADLQDQIDSSNGQAAAAEAAMDQLQQDLDRLKKELDIQSEDYDLTVQAYERLAELFYAIVSGEASANALLPEFQKIGDNLGAAAHEVFEYLYSRGE